LVFTVIAAMLLALVLSFAPSRNASAQVAPLTLVQTIDGTQAGGVAFLNVKDVAVDASDNIRVIETDIVTVDGRLRSFDSAGNPISPAVALDQPFGIAIDAAGDSIVVEGFTFTIATRDPSGSLISSFNDFTANSLSVAVAQDGSYLVGQAPARVRRYSPSGASLQNIGEANFTGFSVQGVAVDPTSGRFYANDSTGGANRVLLFNSDGTLNSVFATGIGQPLGVTVDANGNVYVVQTSGGSQVLIFDPTGALIGTIGTGPLLLTNPRGGIAVDSQGRIIVADGPVVKIFSGIPVEDPILEVTIDIKPGSDPNSINPKSKGVLTAATPWQVSAQQDANHVFFGSVSIGGDPAPEGSILTAYIDGNRIAEVGISSQSTYRFVLQGDQQYAIAPPRVFFKLDGVEMGGTGIWTAGGKSELDLKIRKADYSKAVVRAQYDANHVFFGTVLTSERAPLEGSILAAFVDDRRIAEVAVETDGKYRIVVPQSGSKSLSGLNVWFKLNDGGVREIGIWRAGATTELDLNINRIDYAAPPVAGQGDSRISAGDVATEPPPDRFISSQGQQTPSHTYKGVAFIDSDLAPDGTTISAMVKGRVVAQTTIQGGKFALTVYQPRGQSYAETRISYRVGVVQTGERKRWRSGDTSVVNLYAYVLSGGNLPARYIRECVQNVLGRLPTSRSEMTDRDFSRTIEACPTLEGRMDALRMDDLVNGSPQAGNQQQESFRPETGQTSPSGGGGRGFFINSTSGKMSGLNNLMDPTTLAVFGILMTLLATTAQLVRGN